MDITQIDTLTAKAERRMRMLDEGLGLGELDEYNVLTLTLAEGATSLVRAVKDVIKLRDELLATPDGPAASVAKAFGLEIDRALKGQR